MQVIQTLRNLMHTLQLDNAPAGGSLVIFKEGQCIFNESVGLSHFSSLQETTLEQDTANPSYAVDRAWSPHTLSLNYSTGKGVLMTLVHVLVSNGLLNYDLPIAHYWQEFSANGKSKISLREVLSHQTGLFAINTVIDDAENMQNWAHMTHQISQMPVQTLPDISSIAKKTVNTSGIEIQDNTKYSSAYNALICGWILGEVIQRVTGLSLQKALEKYLTTPLGIENEMYFGVPTEKVADVAKIYTPTKQQPNGSRATRRKPTLKPDSQRTLEILKSLPCSTHWQNSLETYEPHNFIQTGLTTQSINALYYNPSLLHLPSYKSSLMTSAKQNVDYHSDAYLTSVMPAVNCVASAHALATMYAMLANKGTFGNKQLINQSTFEQLSRIQITAHAETQSTTKTRLDSASPSLNQSNSQLDIQPDSQAMNPSVGSLKSKNSLNMDAIMPAAFVNTDTPYSMQWRLGYHRLPSLKTFSQSGFGHSGYNGSMAWCLPEHQLAVAYVHNYDTTMLNDIRQFAISESILSILSSQ